MNFEARSACDGVNIPSLLRFRKATVFSRRCGPQPGIRPVAALCRGGADSRANAPQLRGVRHGVIVSCPNGVAEVEDAEAKANEAYRVRHGNDHPWLAEHREFGVPREADVVAMLRELDYPHAVFDNAPLEIWLPMLLL